MFAKNPAIYALHYRAAFGIVLLIYELTAAERDGSHPTISFDNRVRTQFWQSSSLNLQTARCSGVGIGSHLANVFNERGFRVFATARKAESLADLAGKGIEALSLVVDDPESVKKCYAEVERLVNGRGLNYLVNNAGRSNNIPQDRPIYL